MPAICQSVSCREMPPRRQPITLLARGLFLPKPPSTSTQPQPIGRAAGIPLPRRHPQSKTPSGPCSAREGVVMFGTPSNVPVVGCRALDRPGFIRSMAAGTRKGPKYPSLGQGCQGQRLHLHLPPFPSISRRTALILQGGSVGVNPRSASGMGLPKRGPNPGIAVGTWCMTRTPSWRWGSLPIPHASPGLRAS